MAESDDTAPAWGVAKTALFRAFVIFSLAYIAPIDAGTNLVIPWIGHHILRIEGDIPIQMTGSGDTMAQYVRLFLHTVVAIVGTGVWTVLAGARDRYEKGLHWFSFALRIVLAMTMAGYGFAKIFDGQFAQPDMGRLMQPYGESSPMGLLWTFMGHSRVYCIFTGAAEIVGGLLLLSRRTQTLGALVVIGVMTNVVMLNFCYDVPVKLYSMRLLMMAMFIAGLDRDRLLALFVRHRAVDVPPVPQLYRKPRAHLVGQIMKGLYAAFLVLSATIAYTFFVPGRGAASSDPIVGLWNVESYQEGGEDVPPLLTDENRWHRFVIRPWGRGVVVGMDGARDRYQAELDEDAGTLELIDADEDSDEKTVVFSFSFVRGEDSDGEILTLTDDRLTIELRKVDPDTFLLRNRGFHFVQEYPFNR
jgi:uncharacterized membrane protein YphA (DoxX/SURF4 family)